MKDLMRADRARHSISRMSEFGTIQLTRQRLRPSLQQRSSGLCPHCGGTGRIRNLQTISLHALRKIKAALPKASGQSVRALMHPRAAEDFQNEMRQEILNLENMYNKKISVVGEPFSGIGEVKID
jgi:ribonuclease E